MKKLTIYKLDCGLIELKMTISQLNNGNIEKRQFCLRFSNIIFYITNSYKNKLNITNAI